MSKKEEKDMKSAYLKFWELNNLREQTALSCLGVLEECAEADADTQAAAMKVVLFMLRRSEDMLCQS